MKNVLSMRLLQFLAALCLLSVIPARAGWTETGSMNITRSNYTQTLLSDGRVLVVGGINGGITGSSEIYDPATGQWSITGSLNIARYGHAATLLSDGKVLVEGGITNGSSGGYFESSVYVNSAEIFDPQTGIWRTTSSMINAKSFHTATLLSNNKVLVVGGKTGRDYNGDTVCDYAEVYDVEIGSWTSIRGPGVYAHAAVLMDNGQVLVTGGGTVGGYSSRPSPTSTIYSSNTNNWSDTELMSGSLSNHTCTKLPDGKILVAGGSPYQENSIFQIFDPVLKKWSALGFFQFRSGMTNATLLNNGKVFFQIWPQKAGLFDPMTNENLAIEDMTFNRGEKLKSSLLNNGKVLITGNFDENKNTKIFGYAGPIITYNSSARSSLEGKKCDFSVFTPSDTLLSFQWKKGGVEIPNATTASFTLNNVQLSDAGSYTVVVTNSEGSVTSQPATLTVIPDSDGDGLGDAEETGTYNTDPNLADSDGDGLTDFAEVRTHNTNPLSKDSDGDGFYDAYELQTGKSPLNAADKPSLVAEARTAIEFSFPSATGKTYRIEGSPNLDTWSTVEDGINGTGAGITRFYSTRDTPVRFFRVEESANP